MTCCTYPVVTRYPTPAHSWWGAMTRQLPWQVLPALSARMEDGLTISQSAGALLVLEIILVIFDILNIVKLSSNLTDSLQPSTIICFWQFLDNCSCWAVDCKAWSNCSLGLHWRPKERKSWLDMTNMYKEYPTGQQELNLDRNLLCEIIFYIMLQFWVRSCPGHLIFYGRHLNFLENGRRLQFFRKWKTTSIFRKMEDDFNFFGKWKMTSFVWKMEDDLN